MNVDGIFNPVMLMLGSKGMGMVVTLFDGTRSKFFTLNCVLNVFSLSSFLPLSYTLYHINTEHYNSNIRNALTARPSL